MSEDVKMTKEEIEQKKIKQEEIEQEAIKLKWEVDGHVGNYKIGTLRYFTEDNQEFELKLASIDEAKGLCAKGLHKKLFLDGGSGNFHFAPSAKSLGDIDSFKIASNIVGIYNNVDNDKEKIKKKCGGIIMKSGSASMQSLGAYKSYIYQIFKYVGITIATSNISYQLTAVRFVKDEAVSCDIGTIQMMRIPSNRNKDYKEFKSVEYYPDTIENHGKIEKFLENKGKDEKEYFYYNPELTIYDNVEDIAKKFIEFIIECEEKYKDK